MKLLANSHLNIESKRKMNKLLIAGMSAAITTTAIPIISVAADNDQMTTQGTTDDQQKHLKDNSVSSQNKAKDESANESASGKNTSKFKSLGSSNSSSSVIDNNSESEQSLSQSAFQNTSIYKQNVEEKDVPAPQQNVKVLLKVASVGTYSVSTFINAIAPIARTLATQNGLYASVMIAQAALESAYGTSGLALSPNYNLFGMKGTYNGNYVLMATLEDDGKGNYAQENAEFRKYPSYQESLQDYVKLIKNGLSWNSSFYKNVWIANTSTYRDATAALSGTYATDTLYATKLNNLIETYNLTKYDMTNSRNSITPKSNTTFTSSDQTTISSDRASTSKNIYTIVYGDTLSKLAKKFNTTVSNLITWNHLSSDLLFVNQKIIVNQSSQVVKLASMSTSTTSKKSETTTTESYKVVKGGTLSKIAQKYKTTIANLKNWNNLKSNLIYVGQTLKVSSPTTTTVKMKSVISPVAPSNSSTITYKVHQGDSLNVIAKVYNVSIANLKKWNDLKSDTIYLGQKIKIKKTSSMMSTDIQTTGTKKYTVNSGDSLLVIGKVYGVSVSNLKKWNHLKSDLIYVGQQLIVKK